MKIYWGLVDRIHLRTETMQTADRCFNLPRCALSQYSHQTLLRVQAFRTKTVYCTALPSHCILQLSHFAYLRVSTYTH